jgi:hypothetical protein
MEFCGGSGDFMADETAASPAFRICNNADCTNLQTNWTSQSNLLQNGQFLQLRLTTASATGSTVRAKVTVGTGPVIWSNTTSGTLVRGYFVMTNSTWNGNLGGLAGATNLMANTKYQCARAGAITVGGELFTTEGPEDLGARHLGVKMVSLARQHSGGQDEPRARQIYGALLPPTTIALGGQQLPMSRARSARLGKLTATGRTSPAARAETRVACSGALDRMTEDIIETGNLNEQDEISWSMPSSTIISTDLSFAPKNKSSESLFSFSLTA